MCAARLFAKIGTVGADLGSVNEHYAQGWGLEFGVALESGISLVVNWPQFTDILI